VSNLWKDHYLKVADRKFCKFISKRAVYDQDEEGLWVVPRMTLYSTIFTSTSILKLALENGVSLSSASCQHAAGRHASTEVLLAAHELGMEYSVEIMMGATRCNRLSVLQFLRAQGCPWHSKVSSIAAERGELESLRWLQENGCPWDSDKILGVAARSGDLERTIWVRQQTGVELNFGAMEGAALCGHTAICAYLHGEQCPWDSACTADAAFGGHVDTLRWLHEHGCDWDVDEIRVEAARSGSLDVLTYLQQQDDIDWNTAALKDMLNAAGACNKLAAAQWLREQGAEWPPVLEQWYEDMITWARAEGCTSPTQ
jgi:hypothetical protein